MARIPPPMPDALSMGWRSSQAHQYLRIAAIIHVLQQQNAGLEAWVADRDRWIAERQHWIGERDAVIEKQARMLAERDGWVADRDRWIEERDVLIEQLRQQQQALLTSRTYRLGKALLSPVHWWRRYQ